MQCCSLTRLSDRRPRSVVRAVSCARSHSSSKRRHPARTYFPPLIQPSVRGPALERSPPQLSLDYSSYHVAFRV